MHPELHSAWDSLFLPTLSPQQSQIQKTFRYLWRFCLLLFLGFSVAFCGPHLLVKAVFFQWLFRGPHFVQILRLLALEKSSDKWPSFQS